MNTQMIIRIDSDLKTKLINVAKVEGKSTSQVVRELIENFILERDPSEYIDDLWDRIGNKLALKGKTLDDIEGTLLKVQNDQK